jgi:hypothetical protein
LIGEIAPYRSKSLQIAVSGIGASFQPILNLKNRSINHNIHQVAALVKSLMRNDQMVSLRELLRTHNWRMLRAIFRAHRAHFDNRWTKTQIVERTAALLNEGTTVTRALATLPDDAREAIQTLLACDGVMPAHHFLAHFGPLPPFRPWRADSPPAPWCHPTSPVERLWFLGFIFFPSTPDGRVVLIPKELRPFLVDRLPQIANRQLQHTTCDTRQIGPDPILDIAHLLAFLQGHDVRPFAGRWLAPRHLRTFNAALSHPDPAAVAARSELQTGYLRFLHYLAEAAGLVAPALGLLKPTPTAWNWLDLSEADRWQTLWDGWRSDLRRSPRESALWQRFRLPAKRPFVHTLLDALSAPSSEGCTALTTLAHWLRRRCIGAGTLPRDGDVLAPLPALFAGPLTWAGLVRTDPEAGFSFTPPGNWLLSRSAEPPASPPTRPAAIHCPDDDCLIILLPEPPDRPPLRPLVELGLALEGRLARRMTRQRFVATLAHGIARARVVQTLSELSGSPLAPVVLKRLETWEAQAQSLTLRRLTVLTAADPQTLNQLAAARSVRSHFRETLSPHHVAVDPGSVEQLLRLLRRRDHTPLVEPGVAAPTVAQEQPDAGAAAYLWLALRTTIDLANLVPLPAVPPVALLDRLSAVLGTNDAGQLAVVTAQAQEIRHCLRDALDGYTSFPAPIADVDHAAIQAAVEQALEQGRAMEIVYHTAGRGERTTRVVEPLRLETRGGAVYLIAYCRLRQSERVFRLDRIESTGFTG